MNRHLLLLALGATLGIVGCGKGNFRERTAVKDNKTLEYAMDVSPTTLDPGRVEDYTTGDLLSNVFEGLVAYDEKNNIVGRLAESWKVSNGGRTWTFKLRPNVKFHNGRTVTADDVKWSFERNCAADFNSTTAINYLRDIDGVAEELAGKTKEIRGIRVVDPLTVEFTIDRPRAYFLGKLTYPCAFVMAKEAVGPTQINDPAKAVGTGPFKITRYEADQMLELTANKDYFLGAPKVDHILRPVIKDSSTRLNLFKTGQLDFLTLDRKDIKGVTQDPVLKSQLVYQIRPAVFYLGINQAAYPPFQNRDVRRAFAMAIDRRRICDVLLEGLPEARSFIPPGVMGYRENYPGLAYDAAAAKALLAKAGYPNGAGLPPLQMVFQTQAPDSQHVVEGIASALRQNLGVNVQLTALDWSVFLEGRNQGKYQSYFLSWYADYLDPENFLTFLMASDSPQNHDHYKNPEFDRLCDLGDTNSDEATRIKYYQQADDILVQDAGRIPIYFQRAGLLINPRLKGMRSNLFGQLPHLTDYLEGAGQ